MKEQLDKNIHGFILQESEFVKDINSNIEIYEHEKTGAKLMYIKNKDINKTFSIGFKTPPTDDTGVMHILEHSVLCGSKNFPTKKPFVELCKSSLNTFLNAMTYSDKTVYPVSSRNEKDFYNLMHVYLDAVFYPNIYNSDKIFRQEGWRYHIEDSSEPIIYNGVVYNEMKGVFSSPINQVARKIEESLYPDNAYAFESGGDPKYIPELTYEQFLNTHRTLYSPSNAYITLYGDLDLDKALDFINSNYLSNFEKVEVNSNIKKQEPFTERLIKNFKYNVSDEEQLENQDYLAINISIGDIEDVELSIALNILNAILVYSEGAPLRQAFIDAELCDDVLAQYCSDILQPYFSIILKGAKNGSEDKFVEIFEETLSKLVREGINKKTIEGCINIFEFQYREGEEGSTPKGLNYCLDAMGSWVHGASPIERLKFEKHFKAIKKSLEEPYFENIIEKYMLNNTHSSLLIFKPELNMNKEYEIKVENKLNKFKAGLTNEEIDVMVNSTKELIEYQNSEDSKEDLDKIPTLSIDDLDKEVEDLNVDECKLDEIDVYHYNTFTGGISYVDLQFNVKGVKQEDIGYIGLLSDILSRVDTETRDYVDLSNELMCNMGGLSVSTKENARYNDADNYDALLNISCKTLTNKVGDSFNLISEIIEKTSFENEKRIKELIKERISDMEMGLMSAGHMVAIKRMSSYYNQINAYQGRISGLDYYKFLKELDKDIDVNMNVIKEKLYEVKDLIFNVSNLKISIIGSDNEKDVIFNNFNTIKESLNANEIQYNDYIFETEILNEVLLIPSDVQYVAKGYSFNKLGYEYTGHMTVLENILRYGYLWNNIRVKGGAYGAMITISDYGNFVLCSYRDPNVKETIDTYKELPLFVKSLDLDEKELEKTIIGTMSNKQLPLTPRALGRYAIACKMANKDKEYRQKVVDEILSTTVEDLRDCYEMINDVMSIDCQAITGNDKAVEYTDLFKNINNILK